MIDQITVFLENDRGRLAAMCRALGDANISMRALTIADTADYGVARIIADEPTRACEALVDAGYRAKITKVCAVSIPDRAGGLAELFEAFDEAGVNVEYAYCFSAHAGEAVDILRVDDNERVFAIVDEAGFKLLAPEDVYNA
ncbi:MAG: ACT domain-containing protein [Coriobacteriia bacterium]|nr:ACT domain-containing protein [Coriobacteriia bacterium]